MKKNFKIIISLLLVLSISSFSYAQKKGKPFQGSIVFSISYSGEGITPMIKAQQPTEATTSYKDNMQKTEMVTPMTNVVILTSRDSMTSYILYDMGGQKLAIAISTKAETEKNLKEMIPAKIQYVDSSKDIAGYKCKKAIITSYMKNKEEGSKLDSVLSTVYYTTELAIPNPNWNTQYKDLPGVLLEYTQEQKDMQAKFTAKEVKSKKLPDLLFKIPSDYQVMTKEQFRSMMGGAGGDEE